MTFAGPRQFYLCGLITPLKKKKEGPSQGSASGPGEIKAALGSIAQVKGLTTDWMCDVRFRGHQSHLACMAAGEEVVSGLGPK